MKMYWEWEPNYFENYIFRNVELTGEFTVEQFINQFNKINRGYRTANWGKYRPVITLIPNYYYHYNLISGFLHGLLKKGILEARYVSNNGRTETIFKKV